VCPCAAPLRFALPDGVNVLKHSTEDKTLVNRVTHVIDAARRRLLALSTGTGAGSGAGAETKLPPPEDDATVDSEEFCIAPRRQWRIIRRKHEPEAVPPEAAVASVAVPAAPLRHKAFSWWAGLKARLLHDGDDDEGGSNGEEEEEEAKAT